MRRALILQSASLAVVLQCLCVPGWAATAGNAELVPAGRIAAILFLSSQAMPRPRCDLAQVHEGAWDRLIPVAQDLSAGVISRSEIEPVVRHWRVRSSLGVSAGFLDSLSAAFACDRVLVVDVTIHADRLFVAGRVTATVGKETIWSGVAEEKLPRRLATGEESTTVPWVGAIEEACRHLLEQRAETPATGAASDLYLLPVRRTGLDDPLADLVSHCLLRSLIGRGWRIQDPGVTFSRLRNAGFDPRHLDPQARAELIGGAFGVLVIGDVVTDEEAGAMAMPSNEDLSPLSGPLLPSFSVSIRWIDGLSGEVTFAATTYVGDGRARGLFGVPRNPSPVRRVQRATDRLVHAANEKG